MMHPIFVLALLTSSGTAASASSWTVARVRAPEVTYILKLQGNAYVVQAVRATDQTVLWTAPVEPEARQLHLAGPVVLTFWCFSGAYLACGVQALATGTGRELWQTSGKLGMISSHFVLLWDDFFFWDDSPNLHVKLRVLRLPEGTPKEYTLKVSPRGGCGGPVELLNVLAFSTGSLKAALRDGCGTYPRTFR